MRPLNPRPTPSVRLLTATAHAGPKIQPMLADIMLVGPGGEVLIYYKDGNDVVIRNCGKDYPSVTKREDCKAVGPENRVRVDLFKRALKTGFELGDADKLQPLTADEVKAYRTADVKKVEGLKQREKELDAKLKRVTTFIDQYGVDAQSQLDKDDVDKTLKDVRSQLAGNKVGYDAVKKINAMIDEVVDKQIADSSTMNVVSTGKNGNQATYTLLKQYDPSHVECGSDDVLNGSGPGDGNGGGKGASSAKPAAMLENLFISNAFGRDVTIEDRIKDCAKAPNSSKTAKGVKWDMVSRMRDRSTGKYYEVWRDSKSGLLWGDRLDSDYTHYNAVGMADNGTVTDEKACNSDEGKRANAGIREKKWGLPTIEEFRKAEDDGVHEVVPNMAGHWFWSTSLNPNDTDFARGFSGFYGHSYYYYTRYIIYDSVRCVGR